MSKRTLRRAAERKTRKLARVIAKATAANAAPVLEIAPGPIAESPVIHEQTPEPGSRRPATAAQITANQFNAQHSTGPITEEGKAKVAQNHRSHGLTGIFHLLAHERREDLDLLKQSVYQEYTPQTDTERRLADDMIQHYWLTQRAIFYQQHLMYAAEHPVDVNSKQLALFMRYQTTHERSYYKALRELQTLKKQQIKMEVGFDSQKANLQATEAKTRLVNARAKTLEIDAGVRQIMEAPLPGTANIPFDELAKACGDAIATVAYRYQLSGAA